MENYSWYLKRLRSVSLREIPYRVEQLTKRKLDKVFPGRYHLDLTAAKFPDYFRVFDASELDTIFPEETKDLIAKAEDICNHRFDIFGIGANYGETINWHYDPKTKNTWPLLYWGDIDYRDGRTIGGIKFAWEINRLHHLPILALAYSVLGDPSYKKEIFDQLDSWLKDNPYPYGINWISGIELGIRMVNLVYALKLLGQKLESKTEKECILRFVSLHANHLYRYPSKYSSCANHSLAEALGLFVAGVYFRDLKHADKWKRAGRKILEREVVRQIHPDGSSFEHSVPYLQFVVDHFVVYLLTCKDTNEAYSGAVSSRIIASLDFLSNIIDERGNVPNVGDDDDGYLLKLWTGEHNNYVSLLNTGALLFNRPDWLKAGMRLDKKTYFLLGEKSLNTWKAFNADIKNTNRSVCRFYENAGLAVISDCERDNILFVGNSGPLGLEPLSGHGHADALSFWLSKNGQPIFIDPGTYLYHSGGIWRDYFRSTSAHNTLTVDNRDQAKILTDFIFEDFYKVDNVSFEENEEYVIWFAEHDGYEKLPNAVTHKREVVYKKRSKELEIRDTLITKGRHEVRSYYHVHPDCKLQSNKDTVIIDLGDSKIEIVKDTKWIRQRILRGSTEPMGGWYSPRFNRLQESATLVFETEIDGDETLSTFISLANNSH